MQTPGLTGKRVEEAMEMFANKFIAIALGLGLLLSLVSTFGTDEAFILLAALFG